MFVCVFLFVCFCFLFLLSVILFFLFYFWCFVLLFLNLLLSFGSWVPSLLFLCFFLIEVVWSLEGEKGVWFFVSYVASLIFCCCKGDVKLEGGFFFFLGFLCCMLFFVRLGLFPLYFFFNFLCFIIFVSIWSFVQLHKR